MIVSWATRAYGDLVPLEGGRLELQAELSDAFGLASNVSWTSRETLDDKWVDAIGASRCEEVLLTVAASDRGLAQQAVLELAGRLTRQLSPTRPVVRVRFAEVVRHDEALST